MQVFQQETTPEIESLEGRKSALLSDISKLGATLEEMDAKIANHESLSLKSDNLLTDIEEKQNFINGLQKDIQELESKIESTEPLIKEIENLKTERDSLSEEVSRLQSVIRVLQQEAINFRAGKENIIKQLQAKHDEVEYQVFKIEQTKKEALNRLQATLDAHK